jgi:hypothetical protein
MPKLEIRVYPIFCTPAYCGPADCTGCCPNKQALDEFRRWERQTAAKPADPIWAPLVYQGLKED